MNAIVVSAASSPRTRRPSGQPRAAPPTPISAAAAHGASVVVLPELVSSGYVFDSRGRCPSQRGGADGETVTCGCGSPTATASSSSAASATTAAGELFNSAALVDPGGLRAVYRKAHLSNKQASGFPLVARHLP